MMYWRSTLSLVAGLVLGTACAAQVATDRIDRLAAGLSDFSPGARTLPIQEIADDFEEIPDDGGPETSGVDTEITRAPPVDAAPSVTVPTGWVRREKLGLIFFTPPDWEVMEDTNDLLAVGAIDAGSGSGVALGVERMSERDISGAEREFRDMLEGVAGHVGLQSGDADIAYSEPAASAGPLLVKRWETELEGRYFLSELIHDPTPDERGRHLGLGILAFNVAREDVAQTLSILRNSVAYESGSTPPDGEETNTALAGILSYSDLQSRWRVVWDQDQKFVLWPATDGAGYVGVSLQGDLADWGDALSEPPQVSDGEVFGQPAIVSSRTEIGGEYLNGKAFRQVYTLKSCLADGRYIVVDTAVADGYEEKVHLEELLGGMTLALPADAAPCAGGTTSSGVETAGAGPELSAAELKRKNKDTGTGRK